MWDLRKAMNFPKVIKILVYAQQALVFSEAVNVLLSWMLPLSFYYPDLILLVAILFCLFSTQAKKNLRLRGNGAQMIVCLFVLSSKS